MLASHSFKFSWLNSIYDHAILVVNLKKKTFEDMSISHLIIMSYIEYDFVMDGFYVHWCILDCLRCMENFFICMFWFSLTRIMGDCFHSHEVDETYPWTCCNCKIIGPCAHDMSIYLSGLVLTFWSSYGVNSINK